MVLLIFKEEKLCAVLPANRVGTTLYSHQGLTYGGLVLDAEIRLKEVMELFKELLDYLSQNGIEELELKMLPQFYQESRLVPHTSSRCSLEFLQHLAQLGSQAANVVPAQFS